MDFSFSGLRAPKAGPSAVVALALLFGLGGAVAANAASDWTEKSEMTTARADAAAAVFGNEIFVAGGAGISGPKNVFEAYDVKSDHWRPVTALPHGLAQFGMTQAGGRIYITGGLGGGEEGGSGKALWEFHAQSGIWRRLKDMPVARIGHAMVTDGAKLYVVGGEGPKAASMLIYDILADKWHEGAAMPTPRALLSAVIVDSRVYAMGGRRSGVGDVATVEVFDIAQNRWGSAPSLPHARARATAGVLDGKIHLTGGEAQGDALTYADHFVFDPATKAWSSGSRLPTPRHSLVSGVVDGNWYVIGGSAGANVFTVFTATDVVEAYPAK